MSLLQLYIFRHGETDWNKQFRFQGHTDIPLNDLGREQASRLAEKLQTLKPELILSSDLCRALETAEIAGRGLGLPVLSAVELRECRLGEPEGWHRDRVIAHYGEACWQRWTSMRPEDLDFAFPQGETKREQLLRLRTYLERFFAERPELKRVALSSHGGNLRSLIHASENAPTDPVPMPNCVLYKIEYDRSSKRWKFLGEV